MIRFEFRRGEEIHAVELEDLGDGRHRARWSMRGEADPARGIRSEQVLEVDAREVAGGWSLLAEGRALDAVVERGPGETRRVRLPGATLELERLDPLRPRRRAGAAASGPQSVASPMPGRVVEVPVAVGADVEEGQTVIVVEAMKMANELRSPIRGRITAVRTAAGSTVDAGVALVVVEPVAGLPARS